MYQTCCGTAFPSNLLHSQLPQDKLKRWMAFMASPFSRALVGYSWGTVYLQHSHWPLLKCSLRKQPTKKEQNTPSQKTVLDFVTWIPKGEHCNSYKWWKQLGSPFLFTKKQNKTKQQKKIEPQVFKLFWRCFKSVLSDLPRVPYHTN